MQNDVYSYSQSSIGTHNPSSILRKTYGLLGLSFIPCALGAYISSSVGFNIMPL